MKYVLIAILFCTSFAAKSEKVFYVKVNERECLKCYAAQLVFNDIRTKGFDLVLVFREDNLDVKRYAKVNLPGLRNDIRLIKDNDLYSKMDQYKFSELYVKKGDDPLQFQCQVKDIHKYVDTATIFTTNVQYVVPDSIQTTSGCLYYDDNITTIFNGMLQEVYVLNDRGEVMSYLISDTIDVARIIDDIYLDSVWLNLYEEISPALEMAGRASAEIQSIILKDSVLHFLFTLPYPVRTGDTNISIYTKTLLGKYELRDDRIEYFPVTTNDTLPDVRVYVQDFEYFPEQDRYLFLTRNSKIDSNGYYYLQEAKIAGNKVIPTNIFQLDLGSRLSKNTLQNGIFPELFGEYLYFQFTDIILNPYSNSRISVPFEPDGYTVLLEQLKIEYTYSISDIYTENDAVHFIYSDSSHRYFYSRKDIATDKEEVNLPLSIDHENVAGSLIFISNSALLYINKQNEVIRYNLPGNRQKSFTGH